MPQLPKLTLPRKPTYRTLARDVELPDLFRSIERQFATCFMFEALGDEGRSTRYSIIGFDPAHIVSARESALTVDGATFTVENPYYALRELMPPPSIARDYAGGLVGYLSYEAFNYLEPAVRVKAHKQFEQFMFGAYTDGLLFDKLTNDLVYFFHDQDRSGIVKELLSRSTPVGSFKAHHPKDGLTKEEHATVVETVKEQIRAGNTFQCEVGFKTRYRVTGDTFAIYEQLRRVNPSPFMYYLKFGEQKIIGASPELLFSVHDGQMTTRPLAGTIRRGATELEDRQLARQLLHDPKEIAEHTMLVDMHRNDIGKIARFGTVRINDLLTIKKFSHVQHISSEISGLIKPDEDMFSALASNFPMGTVCGTPKIESIKIIDSNEPEARGPYGGGVGYFGFNGDARFALALRSLFLNGNDAYGQASGGIVYDSVPEREYDEVQRKLAAIKQVLTI